MLSDMFTAHFKHMFISVSTWPSFPSVLCIVYATIKGEHIKLCGSTVNYRYSPQTVAINRGGNSTQSRGVSIHRRCYFHTMRNGVSVGLPPACMPVTCSPRSSVSGRLREQVEAICQKSFLHIFFSAAREVVIHNLKASSNDSGIW